MNFIGNTTRCAALTALLFAAMPASGLAEETRDLQHRQLAEALLDGQRAEQAAGTARAQRLQRAALKLAALGARPVEGEDDLAEAWLARAGELGARAPKNIPDRGRVLGPSYKRVRLSATSPVETTQLFLAGTQARITLVTPAKGDAHLQVRAPDDTVACQVASTPDGRECSWLPLYTQRYRLDLKSPRAKWVDAFVIVN